MNLLSTSQLLIILGVFLTPVACSVPAINPESANPEPVTCDQTPHSSVITTPLLSVLTLNLAHGRKDALNQMLQKTSTTRSNLEEIAGFLSDSGADLVALQEAQVCMQVYPGRRCVFGDDFCFTAVCIAHEIDVRP